MSMPLRYRRANPAPPPAMGKAISPDEFRPMTGQQGHTPPYVPAQGPAPAQFVPPYAQQPNFPPNQAGPPPYANYHQYQQAYEQYCQQYYNQYRQYQQYYAQQHYAMHYEQQRPPTNPENLANAANATNGANGGNGPAKRPPHQKLVTSASPGSSPQLSSPVSPSDTAPSSPEDAAAGSALRKQRTVNRAERAERIRGRIAQEFQPNQDSIEKSIAATRSSNPDAASAPAAAASKQASNSGTPSRSYAITIRSPTRQVTKHLASDVTAAKSSEQLVREHRLEFEFEHDLDNEEDDVISWECFDGTRRPSRAQESVVSVVRRWPPKSARYYSRTTSTSSRNDVDSLASLVPRRDMMRTPPTISAAEVHFSRPSIMYNPHANQPPHPASPSLPSGASPAIGAMGSPSGHKNRGGDRQSTGTLGGGVCGADGFDGSESSRVPSRSNPADKMSQVKRVSADNDDVVMSSQSVWGFGSLDLVGDRVVSKQKPGDELVCSLETGGTDVYEWPHPGPKKYVVVLKAQQSNSRAVYISTDSARVFSVSRNAVFTARTRALRDQQHSVH